MLGLDGKLYFTHGDGCCSVQQDHTERPQNFDVVDKGGRHVWSDQLANTLRVNRDGTQFEILADRQRNNYETCLNSFGNMFTSDNDDDGNRGCRVIWVMDGGHYGYRTPGSPRHWGEEVPGNVPKLVGTGNGSPCGIMVYEGDCCRRSISACLRGRRRYAADQLLSDHTQGRRVPHRVQGAALERRPWFRPVDQTAAPMARCSWPTGTTAASAVTRLRPDDRRIYRMAPKGTKAKKIAYDFATVDGLIAALKSPVVATQDAARRGLIARGDEARAAVSDLFMNGEPIYQARALWVSHAIDGDSVSTFALTPLSPGKTEPRLREQAVRILGRDLSKNGHVDESKARTKTPIAGEKHLEVLLSLTGDPDAGLRRELILALRNLPTSQVGSALKTLAQAWDGQDRWYLEALGLALDHRENAFITAAV